MKTKLIWTVCSLVLAVMFMGCGTYVKPTQHLEGADVTHVGRVGFLGTDYGATIVVPKPSAIEPVKVKLEKKYHRTVDTWTAKCSKHLEDPKQRKNWKHEEIKEDSSEEVLNPAATSQAPIVVGGSNPSVGNFAVPAAAMAGGIVGGAAVLRPDKTTIGSGSGSGGCGSHGCY
jgi:hypothetical protein